MTLAFVFPGQGSQAVGMLDSFAPLPAVSELIAQADEALGESLSQLIAQGPAESLALTVNTQPAMLLAGLACYRAWRAAGGPEPAAVAGHSLGEYTALTAAGSLQPADAFRLVRLRAQAMQEAVPVGSGSMAAILGLDDDQVRLACRQAVESLAADVQAVESLAVESQAAASQAAESLAAESQAADTKALDGVPHVVEPANFNAPSQVVIAGSKAAVDRACEAAKALGAKRALPLPVSAPFHSSLLRPAGDRLARALAGLRIAPPRIPLVNNVDVAIESDPARIADALVRQSYGPVRWVEVVRRLKAMGVTHVVEFGPGKVLAGLVKRIDPDLKASAVHDAASLEAALKEIA